ncbi:MAG: hypothetical protein ACFB20_01715 [Opitutales bacterium]
MLPFKRRPKREGHGLLWLVDEDASQRAMFAESFQTAVRTMPSVPRAVIYKGPHPKVDARCLRLRSTQAAHAAKFDAWYQSPFERTLFLDNDTYVQASLEPYLQLKAEVCALPYPNFFDRDRLRCPWGDEVPARWQNVNSGVVLYTDSFLPKYRAVWARYGAHALSLPGKDQCLFSLALAIGDVHWQPDVRLQISTTDFAVEFIRTLVGAPEVPKLLDVPLALLQSAFVFHTTADKERFRRAYTREAPVLTFAPPRPWPISIEEAREKALSLQDPTPST